DAEGPANHPPDTTTIQLTTPPGEDRRREHVVEDFVTRTFCLSLRRLNSTEDPYLRVRQPFEQWDKAALAAPGIAGQIVDRMRDLASRRCDEIAKNVHRHAAMAPL